MRSSAAPSSSCSSTARSCWWRGAERNKALGIWGALGATGATAAWLISGPLVDGPGWEWIFFISIPLGLAALALSPLLVEAPDADWGSLQTILLVAGSVAVGATVAQAVVLKAGFRAVAAAGMALLLLGRPRTTPRERLEAVPVPVPND